MPLVTKIQINYVQNNSIIDACPDEIGEDDFDKKNLATPILRTHFADTALWIGKQETDGFHFKEPYEGKQITISISDAVEVPFLWFEDIEGLYEKYSFRIEPLRQYDGPEELEKARGLEFLDGIQEVSGSIPLISTTKRNGSIAVPFSLLKNSTSSLLTTALFAGIVFKSA